jgi:phage shock protein PspC (stress-responsive transcriptional regulator)
LKNKKWEWILMKFCGECGSQIAENSKFCPGCGAGSDGAPVNVNAGATPMVAGAGEYMLGTFAKFSAFSENNATVTAGGKTLQAALVYKIIAGALLVLLFLPFFTVSASMFGISSSESISGWDIAFDDGMDIAAILSFLVPVAIFAMFQFTDKLQFVKGKLFLFTIVLSGAGIASLFLLQSRAREAAGIVDGLGDLFGMDFSIDPGLAFWVSLAVYAVAGIAGYCFMTASNKK